MNKLFPILLLVFINTLNYAQKAQLTFANNFTTSSNSFNDLIDVKCYKLANGNFAMNGYKGSIDIFSELGLKKLYSIEKPVGFVEMIAVKNETYALLIFDNRSSGGEGEVIIKKQKLGNQMWGESSEIVSVSFDKTSRKSLMHHLNEQYINGHKAMRPFVFIHSEDGSKCVAYSAAYGDDKINEKFHLIFFDDLMSKVENKVTVELNYTKEAFVIKEMQVTNNGKIIILGKEYVSTKMKTIENDKPGYKTHLIIIDKNGKIESDNVIGHEDYFFVLKTTLHNGIIHFDGLLAEAQNQFNIIGKPFGIISYSYDPESKNFSKENIVSFTKEQIEKYQPESKQTGLSFQVSYFNNGNKLFTISKTIGGVNGEFNGPINNSYTLLISPDSKIINEFEIMKKTKIKYYDEEIRYYGNGIKDGGLGLIQYSSNNKTYIVFNDHLSNTEIYSTDPEKYNKIKDSGIKIISVDENGKTEVKFVFENKSIDDKNRIAYFHPILVQRDNLFISIYFQKASELISNGEGNSGLIEYIFPKF